MEIDRIERIIHGYAITLILAALGCDSRWDDEIDPFEVTSESGEAEQERQIGDSADGEVFDKYDDFPAPTAPTALELAPHVEFRAGCGGGPWPRNSSEVALCNEENQRVIVKVAFPEGKAPKDGWPAVVLLHGSGGLFRPKSGKDPSPGACSEQLESQFAKWSDLLTEEGYAVIMPASFYSRGFCDWDKDKPKGMDVEDRQYVRLFDTRAAAAWACDHDDIDCDRMAALGFSNGGSIALLSMHDDLSHAEDKRLAKHGTQEWFVGAIAYYPGCGFESVLSDSTSSKEKSKFYSPQRPVVVHHADYDSLLDYCDDIRDPQVEKVMASKQQGGDWFDLVVHDNAKHGFDTAGSNSGKADKSARAKAQDDTLDQLAAWFE